MISVFGSTGFIGSKFVELYPDETIQIPRDSRCPLSDELLYLISTTDNYNVFENPKLDIDTNLNLLVETLVECRERKTRINFVSSWFVYGDCELPAREELSCNPKGFYSITKKAAEELLISYCQTFGIEYRIFRLANVIGRGDVYSKKKNALQYLAEQITNHNPIDLYYDGEFIRDYIHVHDACRAMMHLLNHGPINTITNIGRGLPVRFRYLIDYLMESTNSKSSINPIDPPTFHKTVQVKDMYLDISRLSATGFEHEVSLEEALVEIVQKG